MKIKKALPLVLMMTSAAYAAAVPVSSTIALNRLSELTPFIGGVRQESSFEDYYAHCSVTVKNKIISYEFSKGHIYTLDLNKLSHTAQEWSDSYEIIIRNGSDTIHLSVSKENAEEQVIKLSDHKTYKYRCEQI